MIRRAMCSAQSSHEVSAVLPGPPHHPGKSVGTVVGSSGQSGLLVKAAPNDYATKRYVSALFDKLLGH